MENEEEYYNIQLELTDQLWQYCEKSPQIEVIEKKQNKNKELILLLLLALLKGEKTVKEINKTIEDMFKSEKVLEQEYLEDILKNVCSDSYDINNFIMKLGDKNYLSSKLKESDVSKIINEMIDKKTNKNRISDNKNEIIKKLIDNIGLFATGILTETMIRQIIEDIFLTNADYTKRMFENEIHRCTDRAYMKWCKDNNINRVMYVSRLETNTCSDCRENHGKVFKIDDENIIELPKHVRCKCFYATIPNNNWKNDFGKVNFNNFKKWSDKNNG